jgi:hypothetical protein
MPATDSGGTVSEQDGAGRYPCLGKYRVLNHIATGGMGTVYRALDPETGRVVALKLLPADRAANPRALERFRREARAAARLRHDNIVAVHELGETNGTLFLAMEFVDGVDLHEHVSRSGPLHPDEAVVLLAQMAWALDHLHRQGLVHRDVKPANFLVTYPDGRPLVKLTDLGLAREEGGTEFRLTRDGHTVGTIDYMAPEQACDSAAADIRSDLYALGCTLFHMLTGEPPFADGSLPERLYKHAEAPPPDVRRFNPAVPAWLAAVLERLLAKRPEDRYQTPAALLADLAARRAGRAATPAGCGAGQPAGRGARPAPSDPAARSSALLETPARRTGELSPSATAPHLPPGPPAVPACGNGEQRAAGGRFRHARECLAAGHRDYGISLLLACCRLEPANLIYRQTLREVGERPGPADRTPRRGVRRWWELLAGWVKFKSAQLRGAAAAVLEYGERLLLLAPRDAGVQLALAAAAEKLGLAEVAVWMLERLLEQDAGDARAHRGLARLFENQQQLARAVQHWHRVSEIDPDDSEARDKARDLAARRTAAAFRVRR